MSLEVKGVRRAALSFVSAAIALSAVLCAPVAQAAGRVQLAKGGNYDPADGFIVGYRAGSASRSNPARALQSLQGIANRTFSRTANAPKLRRDRRLGTGADLFKPDRRIDRAAADRIMSLMAQDPDVEYVEPNIRLYATYTPNDAYFSLQTNLGTGDNTYATQAWDTGYRGQGKIIAIVDTGITDHPDLNANVLAGGYDFISDAFTANDGNGRDANPTDPGDWQDAGMCTADPAARSSKWHGTHVAGIAAAVTNNGTGVAGMAFNAKILPVRALGRCGGSLADVADAVTWASGGTVSGVPGVGVNRANVINMSLAGAGVCDATMQNAINGAVARGVPVVVSAGNDNADAGGYVPANCANVIVVGTHNHIGSFYGEKESFSNYGFVVDLSAPGYMIASAGNTGTTTPVAAQYYYKSGTSMSAPHVAAVIAMMMSKPSADCAPAVCEQILKENSDLFMGPPQYPLGWGRLNALKAINATP